MSVNVERRLSVALASLEQPGAATLRRLDRIAAMTARIAAARFASGLIQDAD
jgi:hypothetical protein